MDYVLAVYNGFVERAHFELKWKSEWVMDGDGQISNQILHAKSQIFKHEISNRDIKSQSQIFKNTQIPNLLTPKAEILVKSRIGL